MPSANAGAEPQEGSTQPHVAPGSYNNHYYNTISKDLDLVREELPNASFMSDTFRTIYTGQAD